MHIDDGVLSVASERIIKDLNMTESQLGFVEAALYIGIIIGSVLCPFLFSKLSPKILVITAVIFNASTVASWSLTSNYWLLATFRTLNGIFLVRNLNTCLIIITWNKISII